LKIPTPIFYLLVAAAFIGCAQSALLQMRRDNQAAERRIAAKSRQLEDLEAQHQNLEKRKKALLSKLTHQQMTIAELDRALKNLRDENERMVVKTKDQKQRKEALDRQFREYQNRLDTLNENKMSMQSKEKKLQELKDTIRKYLTLDLEAE
jgi:chromosome segregation ATPase